MHIKKEVVAEESLSNLVKGFKGGFRNVPVCVCAELSPVHHRSIVFGCHLIGVEKTLSLPLALSACSSECVNAVVVGNNKM
jgi:hypothetical protein